MVKVKRFISMVLLLIFSLSAISIFGADANYDEEGAYWECYTLYPYFVEKVKAYPITDKQIITFLGSVEDHLLTRDEVLTPENFDEYMFDAIKDAFNKRKNIKVREALSWAYPDSVTDAMKGVVPEEFMPIYETVKRYLFGIKEPVITISKKTSGEETIIYAHSVNLPVDCIFLLAVYDSEDTILHIKRTTPNTEEDGIHCICENSDYAKLYAWDKTNLSPICDSYKLIIKD